jgi:ribonuclease P protein component
VVVFLAPGRGDVATIAGGKIGGAVERNRARRILRAAVREAAPEGVPGRDLVVVARSTIRGSGSPGVAEELRELLRRADSTADSAAESTA